jgi:putative addiction module component (TIGR02574 family)
MSTKVESIAYEMLGLPTRTRAELALRLIRSLDESVDKDAEAEWMKEIDRRVKEIDEGRAKCSPASESIARIRRNLRAARRRASRSHG